MNSGVDLKLHLSDPDVTLVIVGATCEPLDRENGWGAQANFLSCYLEGDPEQTNLFPRGWTLEPTATVAKHALYQQVLDFIVHESTE